MNAKILILGDSKFFKEEKNVIFLNHQKNDSSKLIEKIREEEIKGVIFLNLEKEEVSTTRILINSIVDILKKDFYPSFLWVTKGGNKIYGVTNINSIVTAIKFINGCVPVYTGEYYLK